MTEEIRDIETIAREVLACAQSWMPEARLVGNVRADEVARLARAVLPAEPADHYPVRVCVLIDVDTDDPAVAYGRVLHALNKAITAEAGFDGWESSDGDWYGPDGEPLTEDQIHSARRKAYTSEDDSGSEDE